MNNTKNRQDARVLAWRKRFGVQTSTNENGGHFELESADGVADAPEERIRCAREEMKRIVMERFGGDAALLAAVQDIVLTSQDAVKVLQDGQREPAVQEYNSLEAIVAFDGTRPSFLVREGKIDLESSFSTSQWKTALSPRLLQLEAFAACVGRVEIGQAGIGTAFLVAPTLAITNRHVAQAIAQFGPEGIDIHPNVFLDFGREHQGRESYDRRVITGVAFAGARVVEPPIEHTKLDLALLRVEPSSCSDVSARLRKLELHLNLVEIEPSWTVAAVGYPGDWRTYVPPALRTQHEEVIARLLDGDSGCKRIAPGLSSGMLPGVGSTATHDATTINGNSGSPLAILSGAAPLRAAGLHYGGQWQGERTNWAHLLSTCGNMPVTGGLDLRSALAQQEVVL